MPEMNEKSIKAATPGQLLRCSVVKGLQLRATATGKSFFLYYRFQGQERRPKLGEYGQLTLTQARDAARELLKQVAMGKDPSAAKHEGRNERTVADLWDAYWLRHGSKKKSGEQDLYNWGKYLAPRFAKKRISTVKYDDVADMMDSLKATPYMANRLLALLSKMFNMAVAPFKWVDHSPCKGVVRYKEEKRRRYMKGEEAANIAALLNAAVADNPASVAFIYLLILTGARKSEIANAKWEHLDGSVLRLPESKTGFRQIFLPEIALQVLGRLPRTGGTITGIASPKKLWERIRKEAGAPDLKLHDLRHSFASTAISAGISLAQIGELLGHANTQTTKRYAHLVEEAALSAAETTASKIAAAMQPRAVTP